MSKTIEIYTVTESFTDVEGNCHLGENIMNIEDTCITNLKDLYRHGLKMFGRCVSKVHIDLPNGKRMHVGYVFMKREKYEDCDKHYTREVWLTIEHYNEIRTREYLPI